MTASNGPIVFGFGNPLLDIQICTDASFWEKYKLIGGGFCFQGDDQKDIYEEMQRNPNAKYIPGGATLNSMRVCQGLLQRQHGVFYTGCVAEDDLGRRMVQLCEDEGLFVQFTRSSANPTGVCGVSIVDGERSLCTRLGAANDFNQDGLMTPEARAALQSCKIAYTAGFFLTVCAEGMLSIAKECNATGKIYCISLSATFLVEFFKDQMMALMPHVDVLCGNETEFEHFAKVHEFGEGLMLEEIAVRVAQLPKANKTRHRIAIITQGSKETIVASYWKQAGTFKITKYPVFPVPSNELVDTNAAGDAFVGGFLYGAVKSLERGNSDLDLDTCLHFANLAGGHVVRRSGCTFDFSDEERGCHI